MTTNEIAEAVQKYAVENYENSGWDYIVECWTLAQIEEELINSQITSLDKAIVMFGKFVDVLDDRRKDVRAEIF